MNPEEMQARLSKLEAEKAAYKAQSRLLENFVSMARSSSERELLRNTLQETLDVSSELTGAENGSLFLIDETGAITDSILVRGELEPEERSRILGRVMDKGLAGWVRRQGKIGLITDTEKDDRWLEMPDQPYKVRSVLSVPIKRDNMILGILTLMHPDTNHFTNAAAGLMEATAHQMGLALSYAGLYAKLETSYRSLDRAKKKVEEYSKALDEELEKGKLIQRDFLPSELPVIKGWEIEAYFQPALQVSGDFYDFFTLPDNRLALVIADVSGKGVGAALFMALVRSLLRVYSSYVFAQSFDEMLGREFASELPPLTPLSNKEGVYWSVRLTNDYLYKNHGEEGMFATLFFGVIDTAAGEITYVNAGHEPIFVVGESGIIERWKKNGPAVGLLEEPDFEAIGTHLEDGEALIGYTDGVTEARSPGNEMYTRKRLESILDQPLKSGVELLERIKIDLGAHAGNAPQSDDITMILVRRSTSSAG